MRLFVEVPPWKLSHRLSFFLVLIWVLVFTLIICTLISFFFNSTILWFINLSLKSLHVFWYFLDSKCSVSKDWSWLAIFLLCLLPYYACWFVLSAITACFLGCISQVCPRSSSGKRMSQVSLEEEEGGVGDLCSSGRQIQCSLYLVC